MRRSRAGRPSSASRRSKQIKLVVSGEVVAPRMLRPDVPRDLETICLKCLEKEPGKRYESAEVLADDLGRFLADRPIVVCRASRPERVARRRRRNPWVAGLAAAVFASLTLGSAVSTVLMVRAVRAEAATRKQRDRAETEAAVARAVNEFLNNDLLAQASAENNQATPGTKPDPNITVRTVLDRAAARIGGKFLGNPVVEASVRRSIGQTYKQLGLYPDAQPHLEAALKLRRQARWVRKTPPLSRPLIDLGLLFLARGQVDLAKAMVTEAYDA